MSDFNKYTPKDEKIANEDVLSFLSDMSKADNRLRTQHEKNQEIFEAQKENMADDLN